MDALDGNAIAGQLFELFGREMTAATGACASCGANARVAELRVYARAPGSVVRCPACGSVVMVLVDVRGTLRAYLDGFGLHDR
jgi:DNA-directed RNA polymerase subunit RPC12/RpoP